MKTYGPYQRKDGRLHIIEIADDGTKRTVSFPKWLVEQKLGRRLDPDLETIHHIDGDFTNNDWANLEILPRNEHARREATGRPSPLKGTELGWTHGTTYGWQKKKCDCVLCVAAKAAAQEERNRRRRKGLARGPYKKPADLVHGQDITLYRKGCKCLDCKRLNATKARNQ